MTGRQNSPVWRWPAWNNGNHWKKNLYVNFSYPNLVELQTMRLQTQHAYCQVTCKTIQISSPGPSSAQIHQAHEFWASHSVVLDTMLHHELIWPRCFEGTYTPGPTSPGIITIHQNTYTVHIGKGLPLQVWAGPWESGRLRLRIFSTFGTMKMVRLSPLRTGHLYLQEFPGTHF
jgi:hypothetical protein